MARDIAREAQERQQVFDVGAQAGMQLRVENQWRSRLGDAREKLLLGGRPTPRRIGLDETDGGEHAASVNNRRQVDGESAEAFNQKA